MPCLRVPLALLLFILCAVLPSTDAQARNIDRFVTGSWYNPAQNGHGFSIEFLADGTVVIYWYTYHPDGTSTFIIAIGQSDGMSVTAQAYYNTGMRFGEFNPEDRTQSPWGSITITFHDCFTATVEYDSDFEHEGVLFGSGSFPIQKLAAVDQLQCQEDARAGIFEGSIYSSFDNQLYYGFVLIAPGGDFVAYSDGGIAAFGQLGVNGLALDASGIAVSLDPNATFSGQFSGNGDFSAEYRLFALYEVTGGDRGFGDFFASPALYRRMITLPDLAGDYRVRNPVTGFAGDARIRNNGTIDGTDELGCVYSGNLQIPDTRFNVFKVSVTISQCPGFNGTYEGLGSQIDWFVVEDRRGLRVLVTDGDFGFLLLARK